MSCKSFGIGGELRILPKKRLVEIITAGLCGLVKRCGKYGSDDLLEVQGVMKIRTGRFTLQKVLELIKYTFK